MTTDQFGKRGFIALVGESPEEFGIAAMSGRDSP
jgi:hypothetical protein